MTPAGLAQLKLDEGCRLTAYQDTVGVWTVGYGCTGPGIVEGVTWTAEHAEAELLTRVAAFEGGLRHAFPWFDALPPVRADVLTNVTFNIGLHGILGWPTTTGHVRDGLYASAAHDLRNEGKWNRQVGARAERLAKAMETGSWAS